MRHCCEKMSFYINENKVGINYYEVFREYSINLKTSSAVQQIQFCPWCGTKLPLVVDDKWEEILEDMFDNFDGADDTRIPQEFKSDEWWKKRKL